ncbi:MAG: hypothetical protein FWF69_10625 [Firmicutes bacterium]|nr:hypothetical protein [Bacillota bacterium]
MKKNPAKSIFAAALAVVLTLTALPFMGASVADEAIDRSRVKVSSYSPPDGKFSGTIATANISIDELKQYLSARGLELRLPTEFPADFGGQTEPTTITLTGDSDHPVGKEPEWIFEGDYGRSEYETLSPEEYEELTRTFTEVTLLYETENDKCISLILSFTPNDRVAQSILLTMPDYYESKENGFMLTREYDTNTQQYGKQHICQIYLYTREDVELAIMLKAEGGMTPRYAFFTEDFRMDELMKAAESVQ